MFINVLLRTDLIYSRPETEESKLTDEQVYCVAACIYRDLGIVSKIYKIKS